MAPDLAVWEELTLLLRAERPEPGPSFATRSTAARGRVPSPPARGAARLAARRSAPALGRSRVPARRSCFGGGARRGRRGGRRQRRAAAAAAARARGGAAPRGGGAEADARRAARPASPAVARPTRRPRSDARRRARWSASATLTLAAPARDIDLSRPHRRVTAAGGFVASPSVDERRTAAALHLRVPSANLDAAIRGCPSSPACASARASVDITARAVSARERLRDARAERDGLLRQLANAVTVNETASLRARLRIVSREIAAARAALRAGEQPRGLRRRDGQLVPRAARRRDDGRHVDAAATRRATRCGCSRWPPASR